MPTAPAAVTAGLLGLFIGSILKLVAFRLSQRESLSRPGSCPAAPVSARYPLVEGTTAVLAALVVVVKGPDEDAILPLVLLALLVPVTVIDLERQIIPNRITGPGAVLAVVLALLLDPAGEPARLVAGLAAAGFLLVALLAYPDGMGMGDVKLAGMLGLFLGRDVALAMLVALVLGTVVGMGVMARKGIAAGRKTKVPFGPFLALGGVAGTLVGDPVVSWYLTVWA